MTIRKIPYAKHTIGREDIESVVGVFESDRITQGPKIEEFEKALASFCQASHAVAVSSGTAALHCAIYAAGIGPGDEVIVPPLTFVATANAIVYQGGTPIFADVLSETLLIDPQKVEALITSRTKAIVAVDYAGQPCDYDRLRDIAKRHRLLLIADSCHALGASFEEKKVGTLADLTVFSFHPSKHIATGEGGMVCTERGEAAQKMRIFRNHGITTDELQRFEKNTWLYEMTELGFNYRITDFQCALGLSQLKKLLAWIKRRREIASRYDEAFRSMSGIAPLQVSPGAFHVYHLYVIRLKLNHLKSDRAVIFKELHERGVGVNVHYIPVHLQPFYKKRFGTRPGMCPVAEQAYEKLLSLPMYHGMSDEDVKYVISMVREVIAEHEI